MYPVAYHQEMPTTFWACSDQHSCINNISLSFSNFNNMLLVSIIQVLGWHLILTQPYYSSHRPYNPNTCHISHQFYGTSTWCSQYCYIELSLAVIPFLYGMDDLISIGFVMIRCLLYFLVASCETRPWLSASRNQQITLHSNTTDSNYVFPWRIFVNSVPVHLV